MLAPVHRSFETDQSIQWTRVNYLPQFVYFDHSIHIHKGVGCTTCHGPVGDMPLTWQNATLQMRWCVDCHRQPELYLRPREAVFSVNWKPPVDQLVQGRKLVKEYDVKSLTDCYTCHR